MKTFQKFNVDDELEKEKIFLKFAHIDELEIKFDFIDYESDLFYFYKKFTMLCQDKVNETLYMSIRIWSVFQSKTNLNHNETKKFMTHMLDKYFNLNTYISRKGIPNGITSIDKHFKL